MKQLAILLLVFSLGCTEKQTYESADTQTAAADVSKSEAAPTTDYAKYVGVYKMQGASFEEVAITQENGKLYAQAKGERKVEIYPEKENIFNVPAFNAKIAFTDPSEDGFSGITVLLDGSELKGKKEKSR
jgi:outer membrane lipoprotein-sorting protein